MIIISLWPDRIPRLQMMDRLDHRFNAGFVHEVKALQLFSTCTSIGVCQSADDKHDAVKPGQVFGILPATEGKMVHPLNQRLGQAVGDPAVELWPRWRAGNGEKTTGLVSIDGIFRMTQFRIGSLW